MRAVTMQCLRLVRNACPEAHYFTLFFVVNIIVVEVACKKIDRSSWRLDGR